MDSINRYLTDKTASPLKQIDVLNRQFSCKITANSYFGQILPIDQNNEQLFDACMSEDLETIETLLAKGYDPNVKNRYGNYLLYCTIANGKNKSTKLLLDQPNIDLTVEDQVGNNMLYCAVIGNNFEIVKLLVDKGVDVNHRNTRGMTVLHELAIYYNMNDKIVGFLMKSGADPLITDNKGQTVYMLAEQHNNQHMFSYSLSDCFYKVM